MQCNDAASFLCMAVTTNNINLQAGLPTTNIIRCVVEAEWLCKIMINAMYEYYREKHLSATFTINPHLHTCCICISPHLQKSSHKCGLLIVPKMKFIK